MEYIRKTYSVPAKRGGRIEYRTPAFTQRGTITGTSGPYLRVRIDGDRHSTRWHPTTDGMSYL